MRQLVLGTFALAVVGGCASTPVRDFHADYAKVSSRSVKIDGYPPFNVAELREQKRLKVELNLLAQTFGAMLDPTVLLGLSDGIPPSWAHQAAARAYLAESGRPACAVTDAAVSPNGREFDFRYACPGA